MSVRDLPAILRIISGASTAHVIVVHVDHREDVVSFNLSDLGPAAEASLKSILHEVYLRRGRSAVMARLAGSKKPWLSQPFAGLKKRNAILRGNRTTFGRWVASWWVWLSSLSPSSLLTWRYNKGAAR